MKDNMGHVMDKEDFLSHGVYDKEYNEGILISANEKGGYNIGIQLGQDKVLKVDEVSADEVRAKVYEWAPQVVPIQSRWGEPADLQNYDGLHD
ncbi:MAG: hypothetical protein ACM3QW_06270 [Ignavibacteriales bacterium]